ncbi:33774_t:CDS:1, partial [Racocetra persica]
ELLHKLSEFLTKNEQREHLDSGSYNRIKIEKENRLFLESYWELHLVISYWYGYYLYYGIGGGKDENSAINLFKKAANEGYEKQLNSVKRIILNIQYLEKNYFIKFENALTLHRIRNGSNKLK